MSKIDGRQGGLRTGGKHVRRAQARPAPAARGSEAALEPHKARARRHVLVARDDLEARAALRAAHDDHARVPRDARRDQKLVVAARAAELHPADLVEAREGVPDERELRLDREDRDRVPARVLHAGVPVRDVEERLREVAPRRGGRLREQDLGREHLRARGEPGRDDGEVRDERGGPGGGGHGGDGLLRERGRGLVHGVELVAAHDDVPRAGALRLVDLALDLERARARGAVAREAPDGVAALQGGADAGGEGKGKGKEGSKSVE